MNVIDLNGTGWIGPLDFFEALRSAIGAPEWRGLSPAAFVDSMIWHDFNGVRAPYSVHVTRVERAPDEVKDYVHLVSRLFETSEDEHFVRHGVRVGVGLRSD